MADKQALHILIMPSWYKSVDTPVLGTFFEEQARALQNDGYQVGIMYPEFTPAAEFIKRSSDKFDDFYVDKGIPTFHMRRHGGVPKLRRLSYKKFSQSANTIFEEYCEAFGKPDIIHAHSIFHAGIAAYFISKKHNIPMVITEHLTAYLMGYINNNVDINVAKEIFEGVEGALIVSNNFRKDLEENLNLKSDTFTVIHNLVSDLFFQKYTPISYNGSERFRFFTNSFLLPRKQINLIIDAINIMIKKGLDVELRIGGEGPLLADLQKQINEIKLHDRITLTGKLWRQEVKEEIDRSHCFVLASQYETFGVVLIESLACGRPVICTDSGGPRDFITSEQGIMVEMHSAEALASAMEEVMKNYNKFDQKEMISYCYKNFNEHHISSLISDFYHKILVKNTSSDIAN